MDNAEHQRQPNPRGSGGELRTEIVNAALRLVEDTPDPSAITLRGVARQAGITAPSIYSHFENLDAVMAAVIDLAFDKLLSVLKDARAEGHKAVARLRALCRAYVAFAVDSPRLYNLLFSQEKVTVLRQVESGLLPPKQVDTMPGADAFAMLVQAVTACVEEGNSTSTDPQRDATLLWTALHGYVTLLHTTADFPWPARDDMLDQYANHLAHLTD
ncbi:TetR/AcrR family transcriptional regulator [Streptomyces sp. NPDC020747]|uniref:TetR/AcrR family transcriptional regulator n=1 Tax=Streptomyces sp. NPDC020747 TaxID=3365086 RepID=UPI003792D6E9